jgi:hypothetical protein
VTGPTTPPCKHDGLGCSAFARRYWRNHYCFLFLWVLRWFTSPRCPLPAYGFSGRSFGINQREFPHSEIPGSKLICSSPGLIAAYRVLHRLLAPRHSPYALSSLTIRNSDLERVLSELRTFLRPYAHCVCVVGKTTVCRIFSCQRAESSQLTAVSFQIEHGGEYRARTGDLLVANQALSQLS